MLLGLAGSYVALYYVRRVQGVRFPVADQLIWNCTEPVSKFRIWHKIDRPLRKLITHRWQADDGGFVEVSEDCNVVFKLGSFESKGSGRFLREPPLSGGYLFGFSMKFQHEGISHNLSLFPVWENEGRMSDHKLEAVISRMLPDAPHAMREVYRTILEMPNKTSHRVTVKPHITNSNHESAAGHRWI